MTRKAIPVERLREAAMARRSSLYGWMMQNHDTFAETVAEAVRPNWDALAETFAAEGLADANNNPPSAETTRQTWWKVRKAVKARRAKRPPPPPQPESQLAKPVAPQTSSGAPPVAGPAEESRLKFPFSKTRKPTEESK